MGLVYPMDGAPPKTNKHAAENESGACEDASDVHEDHIMTGPSINRKFTQVISSIGYNEAQQERILKSFTIEKKIYTIVSLQKFEEKRKNIAFYMNQLRVRGSLMSLMFLHSSLEILPKNRAAKENEKMLYLCFENEGGIPLVCSLFGSQDKDFLESLLKFVIHLKTSFGSPVEVLRPIIARRHLLPEALVCRYINTAGELGPVCGDSLCVQFLCSVANDVLGLASIDDELGFVFTVKIPIDELVDIERLRAARDRFVRRETYDRLLGLFADGGVPGSACGPDPLAGENRRISDLNRALEAELKRARSDAEAYLKRIGELESERAVLARENSDLKKNAGDRVRTQPSGAGDAVCSDNAAGSSGAHVADSDNAASSGAGGCGQKADARPVISAAPASKPKLGGRFGSKNKTQKKSKFADRSYAGLKWNKTTKQTGSIFDGIDSLEFESQFSLDEFDCFAMTKKEGPADSKTRQEKEDALDSRACLDSKKNYALNIALGRVRISNRSLLSQIVRKSLDNENLINQFILYFPTGEEIDAIKASDAALSRAELFFKEAEDIDQVYSSLHNMRFMMQYKNRDYLEMIDEARSRYRGLLESKELVRLFSTLLVVGNVLNVNTFSGNAGAFSIDSLGRFKTKEILSLVSGKINKKVLVDELCGCSLPPHSIEGISQEVHELRRLFCAEYVDAGVREQVDLILERFGEMLACYKAAQRYFMVKEDDFLETIYSFVGSLE